MQKKILFIVPYPLGEAPSQRFRFEQYFEILKINRFEFEVQSFLSSDNWRVFYNRGSIPSKILALLSGFVKRFILLFSIPRFDFIFIHREAVPVGPPVVEWIIAKIFRKKIIYDFDDAIWMTDNKNESPLAKIIRWRSKVSAICKWSYKISCGNDYLRNFAARFNSQAILNPTTINTESHHSPSGFQNMRQGNITIGWTGSHSTLKYLSEIETVLMKLENDFPQISFTVIADRIPDLKLKSLKFIPWNEKTEVSDLSSIDIGIMPLPNDEWVKGKCGFKALQYMAMEIPSVVSAVGVNTSIVIHNQNGFLASNVDEWYDSLKQLIESPSLRKKFGIAGRSTVVNHFSVQSNSSNFLSLFS